MLQCQVQWAIYSSHLCKIGGYASPSAANPPEFDYRPAGARIQVFVDEKGALYPAGRDEMHRLCKVLEQARIVTEMFDDLFPSICNQVICL